MRKSPKSAKQTQKAAGNEAPFSSCKRMQGRASGRRNFIKSAGLTAVAMAVAAPKSLKAMVSTNRGWLEAVEISSAMGTLPQCWSLDTSNWATQECPSWCWIATMVNLDTYYNHGTPDSYQCDYALSALGDFCDSVGDCCGAGAVGNCSEDCDNYGGFTAVYGGSCGSGDSESIASAIYGGDPVVAYIGGCGETSGVVNNDGCSWPGCESVPDNCIVAWAHYITIVGYYDYNGTEEGFWAYDPEVGLISMSTDDLQSQLWSTIY